MKKAEGCSLLASSVRVTQRSVRLVHGDDAGASILSYSSPEVTAFLAIGAFSDGRYI